MNDLICKIASLEEMHRKWDYEIRKHSDDPDWPIWKESALERTRKGQSISYYGIMNGQIITEGTALLSPQVVQMEKAWWMRKPLIYVRFER